uniref:Uncharacterized protein n=1 Tax=Panagrolaimus davidi TaxID=227884 RepID=A0A914R4I3_9BILA
MKNAHHDNLAPWNGKSRTKNYIIKQEEEKLKATVCKISSIVTNGQCYTVTHGKYAEHNIKVQKKIFSATTPSSQSPSPGTIIVILYEIDSASPATASILQQVSPSIAPKIFTPVQKKRPANTVPELSEEKKPKNASSSFATTQNVTESQNASSSSLIGFDPAKFFITPPTLVSPTSSRTLSNPTDQRRIDKLEEQLKETQEKLQKEQMKKEEQKEKYNESYHKCRKLKDKCDKMEQKRDDDQKQFQAEYADLKAQLTEANNDILQLLEKQKSEKDDADKTITELENEIMVLKDSLQQQQ